MLKKTRRSRINPIPGQKWCSYHHVFHPATLEFFYIGRPGQFNSPCKVAQRISQTRYDRTRRRKKHRGFSGEAAAALIAVMRP